MRLADCFEKIHIIHLPFRAERRVRLERNLIDTGLAEASDIVWVRAVDGAKCPPPPWFHAGRGAWGCLQTHVRIAQDALMDGLENYLVLEDDAVFHPRAGEMLERLMAGLPEDWGQLYLGGQHTREPHPVEDRPYILRCRDVCRTHAFAVHRRAMADFQRHVCDAKEYIDRGAWHIDHQLGLAHQKNLWNAYVPAWWIAGQEAGQSNISSQCNPRLWWHPGKHATVLPFIHIPADLPCSEIGRLLKFVHCGSRLIDRTLQDQGLDGCVENPEAFRDWLGAVAREALDMGLLPGIQHPEISRQDVTDFWAAGAVRLEDADLEAMADYPVDGVADAPAGELAGVS